MVVCVLQNDVALWLHHFGVAPENVLMGIAHYTGSPFLSSKGCRLVCAQHLPFPRLVNSVRSPLFGESRDSALLWSKHLLLLRQISVPMRFMLLVMRIQCPAFARVE